MVEKVDTWSGALECGAFAFAQNQKIYVYEDTGRIHVVCEEVPSPSTPIFLKFHSYGHFEWLEGGCEEEKSLLTKSKNRKFICQLSQNFMEARVLAAVLAFLILLLTLTQFQLMHQTAQPRLPFLLVLSRLRLVLLRCAFVILLAVPPELNLRRLASLEN